MNPSKESPSVKSSSTWLDKVLRNLIALWSYPGLRQDMAYHIQTTLSSRTFIIVLWTSHNILCFVMELGLTRSCSDFFFPLFPSARSLSSFSLSWHWLCNGQTHPQTGKTVQSGLEYTYAIAKDCRKGPAYYGKVFSQNWVNSLESNQLYFLSDMART